MRSCAGTGGRGEWKEGRERVTRRSPTAAREKLPAPLPVRGQGRPAAPRTAGKLSENNAHPGGRTGPAPPPRPETGPACVQCRRPRRRSWVREAATAGRRAAPAPPTPLATEHCLELVTGCWREREVTGPRSPSPASYHRGGPHLPLRAARRVKPREGGGRPRATRLTAAGLGAARATLGAGTDLEESLEGVVPEDSHRGHGYCARGEGRTPGHCRGMRTPRGRREAAQFPSLSPLSPFPSDLFASVRVPPPPRCAISADCLTAPGSPPRI